VDAIELVTVYRNMRFFGGSNRQYDGIEKRIDALQKQGGQEVSLTAGMPIRAL
jgi:hypothetical protein